MDEEDFEDNWKNMANDEGFIEKQNFLEYLEAFFTTSDTAESIMVNDLLIDFTVIFKIPVVWK